ncbi:MAG: pitrilysin family protein [Anaerolineae bacterium]
MGASSLDISALPGPETIAQRTFANGMTGLAWENSSSPSVVVHGWLWVGSIDERPDQAGLAGLAASMMTCGTERRTFARIGEEIESLGATLSIHSGDHTTAFSAKCLAEDLDDVLDILTDCLYHSTFPSEHVEKRRGEILTALQQREFNTHQMASLKYYELLYPNHPYGRSSLGYEETIRNLTRADVETFYKDHYGTSPRHAGAVIVGAISAEQGLDVLESALGMWQGTKYVQAPMPKVSPVEQIRQTRTTIPGKTQSDIALGWIGLKRKDADYFPAYVANCILGQFGMMGRIGDHVRDEKGLAYYSYTSLDAGLEPGPWSAIAGVAPENVQAATDAILDEVKRIRQEPVSEEELADTKAFLIGSLPLRLEAKESIAAQIAHMQVYELGLDYLQHYPQQIGAVTAQDVIDVTNKYLNPDAYVISVAGPPEKEP